MQETAEPELEFGHSLKAKCFFLDPEFTNFNHGSFGTVPRAVQQYQHERFLEQERHPDRWFRSVYYNYILEARTRLAQLVHCELEDLVLVENVSGAVNAIVRHMNFETGSL